jgi:hypothetical protein
VKRLARHVGLFTFTGRGIKFVLMLQTFAGDAYHYVYYTAWRKRHSQLLDSACSRQTAKRKGDLPISLFENKQTN